MPHTPLNCWASRHRPKLLLAHRNLRHFPQARYGDPATDDHQVLLIHSGLAQGLNEKRCRELFNISVRAKMYLFDLETEPTPEGMLYPGERGLAAAVETYTNEKLKHVYLKLDAEDAWRTLAPLAALSLRQRPNPVYIASHNLTPFTTADPYSAFDQVCTIFIAPWLTVDEITNALPDLNAQALWEATGGEPLLLQTLYDLPDAERAPTLRRWLTNPPSFVDSWKRSLRQQLKDNPEIRKVVHAAITTNGRVERLSWNSLPLVYGGWVTDRRDRQDVASWYLPKLHQAWARSLLIEMGA